MRPLRYSINVTLDGCCDHRAIPADEDLHRHAVENFDQAVLACPRCGGRLRLMATVEDREALAAAGVHRPLQAGISGSTAEGADSIVVSGGYEDDRDYGDEITYTDHGGNDRQTGRQIANQTLTRNNLALARNKAEGLPVRVVRGAHVGSPYAPATGYRYDGLFFVADLLERGREVRLRHLAVPLGSRS